MHAWALFFIYNKTLSFLLLFSFFFVLTAIQGLVGAIFEGVGVSTGSFFGGLLMKTIGGSGTFRTFGLIALACAIVHFIVQKFLDRFTSERGKAFSEDNWKFDNGGDGKVAVIPDNLIVNGAPANRKNLLPTTDNEFVDVNLDDLTKL